MHTISYLKNFLPSLAWSIGFLAPGLILTAYFFASQYSNQVITQQELSYYDVQQNWLGSFIMNQSWLDGLNRFMDFAFWGVAALVVMLIAWAFGSAKVAVGNHRAVESFVNFREEKRSWRGRFYVVLALRIGIVLLLAYLLIATLSRFIPELSVAVTMVLQSFTTSTLITLILACTVLYAVQYIALVAIKIFKHTTL